MALGFRPLRRADLPLLARWMGKPHVQQWWREPADLPAVEERYGPSADGADPTEVFIVELDGAPAGLAQRYLVDDEPSWKASLAPSGAHERAAGIDYLLGEEELVGKGLGPWVISAFVDDTWLRYPGIDHVVASVSQDNRRSWRALEKAGFERVWAGFVVSDDPSDEGPSYVYVRRRPEAPAA